MHICVDKVIFFMSDWTNKTSNRLVLSNRIGHQDEPKCTLWLKSF